MAGEIEITNKSYLTYDELLYYIYVHTTMIVLGSVIS
jgi:hypothetical protein